MAQVISDEGTLMDDRMGSNQDIKIVNELAAHLQIRLDLTEHASHIGRQGDTGEKASQRLNAPEQFVALGLALGSFEQGAIVKFGERHITVEDLGGADSSNSGDDWWLFGNKV